MAWATPPAFVDGNVLSASQLNVLVDDLNYLRGLVAGVSQPFAAFAASDAGSVYLPIRHLYNTLVFKYEGTNIDDIRIYYEGTEVFHDGDPNSGVYSVNLAPFGLTTAVFYRVRIQMSFTGGGSLLWWWLGEQP